MSSSLPSPSPSYYVYLLVSSDHGTYVGATVDLNRRHGNEYVMSKTFQHGRRPCNLNGNGNMSHANKSKPRICCPC